MYIYIYASSSHSYIDILCPSEPSRFKNGALSARKTPGRRRAELGVRLALAAAARACRQPLEDLGLRLHLSQAEKNLTLLQRLLTGMMISIENTFTVQVSFLTNRTYLYVCNTIFNRL